MIHLEINKVPKMELKSYIKQKWYEFNTNE